MAESIRGLTITIGADTKQFNRELKKADRNIRETNKQATELQKGLELEFDAGRFAEAQRLAQSAIEQTNQKAQALRDQLKYMEDSGTDTNSATYQQLRTELLKTENQAALLKKKLEEIKDIRVDNLAKGFENAGKSITKAGQALAPVSAAAGAIVAGIGAIGKSTVDSAAKIDDLSKTVNLNAEALQKWQYIAMQLGLDQSTLQTALQKTQSAFADLSMGELSPASDALLALGFSAEQAARGMDANFEDMIQRLSQVTDSTQQAYLANELFGDRLGARVIPLLKSGAAGLAQLTDEFQSLGFMTNEQVDALAKFDDEMNRIKTAFVAIKNEVGVALLPVMQSLSGFISEKIIPAVRSLAEWFNELTLKQKNTMIALLGITAALAPILLIVGKLSTAMGGVIRSIGGINKAFTFLAAHPVIAAIGAIIALLTYLYTTNEQFRESINTLIKTIGSALMPILSLLSGLFNTIIKVISPIIDMIAGPLAAVIQLVATLLQPILAVLSHVLVPILDVVISALQAIIGVVMGPLAKAFEWIAGLVIKVFKGVQSAIQSVLDFVAKAINKVIDFVNGIIRVLNRVGKVLGFTIDEVKDVKISAQVSGSESTGAGSSKQGASASAVIAATPSVNNTTITNTNDYSSRNVTIGPGAVVVNNYAAEVDATELARMISLKLAEEM